MVLVAICQKSNGLFVVRRCQTNPHTSAVKNLKPLENLKTTNPVIALRSERGYAATNYDENVVKVPKALRGQIGHFYDVKKVRNNWPPCSLCCTSAGSKSSNARRAILLCPPIPVSSSRTPIGAGRNEIWPAMPLTSAFRCSACPSTTPCARSPAHKTTAGVVTLPWQSGQNPGKSRKTCLTMAVWKTTG